MIVKYEGYLTQQKLEHLLKEVLPKDDWVGREVFLKYKKYRWDMCYVHNNQKYLVEFDGDSHYRDAVRILADQDKDKYASSVGYKTIRVPYFIQLTTETFKMFFDIDDIKIEQNYRHGWIDKKAILPASYCCMGTDKFIKQYKSYTVSVQDFLRQSLIDNITKSRFGEECVINKKIKQELCL